MLTDGAFGPTAAAGAMSKSNQSSPSPRYASETRTVPPAAELETAKPYSSRFGRQVTAVPDPGVTSISLAYQANHALATAATASVSPASIATGAGWPAANA